MKTKKNFNAIERVLTATILEQTKQESMFKFLCKTVNELCTSKYEDVSDMETLVGVSEIVLDNVADWFEAIIKNGRQTLINKFNYSQTNADAAMLKLQDEWRRYIINSVAWKVFDEKKEEARRKENKIFTARDFANDPESMATATVLGLVQTMEEYDNLTNALNQWCLENNLDESDADKIAVLAAGLIAHSSDWIETIFEIGKGFLIRNFGYSRSKAEKAFTEYMKDIWVQNIKRFFVSGVLEKFKSRFKLDGETFSATHTINGASDLSWHIYICSCENLNFKDPIKEFRPLVAGEDPIKKGLRLDRTCKHDDGTTFQYDLTIVKLSDLTKEEYLEKIEFNKHGCPENEPNVFLYNDDEGEQWIAFDN